MWDWIIFSLVCTAVLVLVVAEAGRCPKGGEHRPELRPDGYFCRHCGTECDG